MPEKTRAVNTSKGESEKDNVTTSKIINLTKSNSEENIHSTKSNPEENNKKANKEDKKLYALESRLTEKKSILFLNVLGSNCIKTNDKSKKKEVQDTKKGDNDESSEHVEYKISFQTCVCYYVKLKNNSDFY